jgi:ketosteroid isomerase-like protein
MKPPMPHSPPVNPPSPNLAALVAFFENLTPESVATMGSYYAAQARFVDPFNDIQGLPAIAHIFAHMFETLDEPRFVVTTQVLQGQQCFLTWDFHFRFKRFQNSTPQTIRGATHLVFSDVGLVTLHRDYWDAAQELYEKLPVVGGLMRWLKRRANS